MVFYSFGGPDAIPLYWSTIFGLFVHQLVAHLWAAMANAAQGFVSAYVLISFGHTPGSGTARSSNSMFNLLRRSNRLKTREVSGNESFRKTTLFSALRQGTTSHRGAG